MFISGKINITRIILTVFIAKQSHPVKLNQKPVKTEADPVR